MRKILFLLAFLLAAAAVVRAQTSASGTLVQDSNGVPLVSGQWCFGSTCLTVSNGSFIGAVTPGTNTVTVVNASSTTILTVTGVAISGASWNWNGYVVPYGASYSGNGVPYLPCSLSAQYTQLDSSPADAGWICQLVGGQTSWAFVGPPKPSGPGIISGLGVPALPAVVPTVYVRTDVASLYFLEGVTGTISTTWSEVGGGTSGITGLVQDVSATGPGNVASEVVGVRGVSIPTLATGYLDFNGTTFAWVTPAASCGSYCVITNPSGAGSQTIAGPLNNLATNGVLNAALNTTSGDIGAKATASFSSLTAGGTVQIPVTGSPYSFSTQIVIPVSPGKRFALQCDPGTVLNWTGTGSAILASDNPTDQNLDAEVTNCIVDGTSATGTSHGIEMLGFYGSHLINVTARHFANGAGIYMHGAGSAQIDHPNLFFNKYGLWLEGYATTATAANAITVTSGIIEGNTLWGVFDDYADNTGTGATYSNKYQGISFEGNGTSGTLSGHFFCGACVNTTLDTNFFEGVPSSGTVNMQFGTNGQGAGRIVVTDNQISSPSGINGIDLINVNQAEISTNSYNGSTCGVNAGTFTSSISIIGLTTTCGTSSAFVFTLSSGVLAPSYSAPASTPVTLYPGSSATNSLQVADPTNSFYAFYVDNVGNGVFRQGLTLNNNLLMNSGTATIASLGGASTYCVQVSAAGFLSNTGAPCGSGGGGGNTPNMVVPTTSYTVPQTGLWVRANCTSACTVTLPSSITTGFNVLVEMATTSAPVTIAPNGVSYDGVTTQLVAGQSVYISTDGTGYHSTLNWSSQPIAANIPTITTSAPAANMMGVSAGANKNLVFQDFSEPQTVPAANCNNVTAGAGWSLPASGAPTAACRTGSHTTGGVLQFSASNTAQFQIDIPGDYDSTGAVYAKIYFTQGSNTTASQTITMQMQTGCSSTTDDPAFNAAQAFASATTTTTANTPFLPVLNNVTMTGCAAGGNMNVQIGRSGSDTALVAPNVYWVALSFPRRIVLQAN